MAKRELMFVVAVVAILATGGLGAAEIRLKSHLGADDPVVRLGDVAEVTDVDPGVAERLAALELFPAPPPGKQRLVRAREIHDLLLLRGANPATCELSGASQVLVTGSTRSAEAVAAEDVPPTVKRRAERLLQEAIDRYVRERRPGESDFQVQFALTDQQAALVAEARGGLAVSGGIYPWVGPQRLVVSVRTDQGSSAFQIDAHVALPPMAVVSVNSLSRGAIVRREDVELQRLSSSDPTQEGFRSLEEVVGKETQQAIGRGKVLERDMLRERILVHRRDPVTVYVRSPGIRVTTRARAMEDGSRGDLVLVKSMLDDSEYLAQVCGFQEVEVFARSRKVAAEPVPGGVAAAGAAWK